MTTRRSSKRKNSRGAARHGLGARLRALWLRILGLPAENPRKPGNEVGLIGVDVAGGLRRGRAIGLLSTLAAILVVALGVSALRIELLRIRYALGEAIAEEQRLLDEQRALTAEMRRLRDPVQLAGRARRLGFVRPERLIDLPAAGTPHEGNAPEIDPPLAETTVLANRSALIRDGLSRP